MSGLFKLNWNDLLKSAIVFVGAAVLTSLLGMLQGNGVDWQEIGKVALVAGITFLLHQLASDNEGKLGGRI